MEKKHSTYLILLLILMLSILGTALVFYATTWESGHSVIRLPI
ncbi:MAG: hypothetical protein AB2L18_01595 [Anaerolineaceae bacterium]